MDKLRGKASKKVLTELLREFEALLATPGVREKTIQKFMESHSELIPIPRLRGHGLHFDVVLSEFNLQTSRIPDFAYLTKNSAYWELVLVELERPSKKLFLKS